MRHKESGISRILAKMTILPIALLGIVTTIFSTIWVSSSLEDEVSRELNNLAGITVETLDQLFPGDYAKYENENEILVTKGDVILNSNYDLIDTLKERTGVEYTVFYEDIRIITTLRDEEGNRLVGTRANPSIVEDVYKGQKAHFYTNVRIFDNTYYCYYEPLYNSDGTCVGMFTTLLPTKNVHFLTLRASLPILLLSLVAIIWAFFWSHHYARDFVSVITKMRTSFEQASKGLLSNTVPPELLERKDEFGSMSHSLVDMQMALRSFVEQDMLTGLYNRRFGQQKLELLISQNKETDHTISLALGDIDFFKKFNDTYGHDCGDLVLQEVSDQLSQHFKDYGYCIRWGGEEFLVVLFKGDYATHLKLVRQLIAQIQEHVLEYNSTPLSVTMTFGLVQADQYQTSHEMLKAVDKLLYYGKENGRNRLITTDDIS